VCCLLSAVCESRIVMRIRDERLQWAEAKLIEAQRIALRYFRTRLRVERKPDRSPVTVADRRVEEFLRRALQRAFPAEAIVGEEFGRSPGLTLARSSYWTIDPIDGTRAFSRGLPTWSILVGYVEHGRPVMGVCDFPALGVTVGVGSRAPAYEQCGRSRRRLPKVQRPPPLDDAVILHGGIKWWLKTPYRRGMERVVSRCFLERAYGDAYGHLWVLRGRADAVLEYGVKVWDMVPIAALARATGRVMVDCSGRPCFTGPETLVAHPALAKQIVRTLSST